MTDPADVVDPAAKGQRAPGDGIQPAGLSDVWTGALHGAKAGPSLQPRHVTASRPAQVDGVGGTGTSATNLPRRGRARAVGTVASLKQRTEMHRRFPTAQIVNFRLERYDRRGGRLQPIPVEMRGITITGNVADGERVQVEGRFHDGTLYAKSVANVTTGGGLTTKATGRFGRNLGRPGEAAVLVGMLLIVAALVRFIPQVWINTPFGLHEYRSEASATCQRIADIAAANPGLSFDSRGTVDREQLVNTVRAKIVATQDQYDLLLSHLTPAILNSRRDRVASLLPRLNALYDQQVARAAALPRRVTLDQVTAAENSLSVQGADVAARMNDALAQLAGGTCRVQ